MTGARATDVDGLATARRRPWRPSQLLASTALASLAAPTLAADDLFVLERTEAGATAAARIGDLEAPPALSNAPTIVASLNAETLAPEPQDPPPPTAGETTAPDDEEPILFEADNVTREDESSPIVAEGNVRAFVGARHLRADRLVYDPDTDIVVAEGNVAITDASMETAFAGRVELTGDLRDGIAENFSALLRENAKLAADTALRERGARTRLDHAVYTACDVCKKDGEAKTPTWRIKSLRVTRDEERKVIRFRHATFEIKGVPVLYAPFLQGPDPTVERQSGFLTPTIGASSRLGFNLEIPYYFALSNHQDATFYPKYTSKDGVLWQGEYRRRDVSGGHVIQAGVIDFDNTQLDEDGNLLVDVPGVRWHIFAAGWRNFGERWRAGYDVERVSDDTYLRRYDIRRRGDLRQGLDTTLSNRLRSNLYGLWQAGGSQFSATAYLFQGLRATDVSALTPYVLPLLDFRHDFAQPIAGGRAHVNANFVWLQRAGGVDTQRLTTRGYWEREHITDGGHRFNVFGELRADAFYFHDLHEGTEILPGMPGDRRNVEWRFAPTVGAEWSYPLTRRVGGARLFIEPRVQLLASPADRNPADILNEDSQSIEFDYAGLFEYNKATGFDRFEDGQRMNVGVAVSAVLDGGIAVEGSVGQQFRVQSSDAFNPAVGLGQARSDIVGALNVNFKDTARIENRFRFDDDTGQLRRMESMAFLNFWRIRSSLSYVRLNADPDADLPRREELTGQMRVRMTRHWSAGMGWRQNLEENRTIERNFVLGYADECTTVDLIYRRNSTRDVGLPPDNALLVRFTLRSLVDSGSLPSAFVDDE